MRARARGATALATQDADPVLDRLKDVLEKALSLPQSRFNLFLFGDVADGDLVTQDLTVLVVLERRVEQAVHDPTVLGDELDLEVLDRPVPLDLLPESAAVGRIEVERLGA